jgi:hypothetical protein
MPETQKLYGTGIVSVKLTLRDIGFETETNDCMVRSIQAVTGVPYRDAHAFVAKRFNRKPRKGTRNVDIVMRDIAKNHETIYGFRVLAAGDAIVGTKLKRSTYRGVQIVPRFVTLAEFVRRHRTGRYLCWSHYHAFAIVDGVVFDTGAAGPRTNVAGFHEMLEDSKCQARGI